MGLACLPSHGAEGFGTCFARSTCSEIGFRVLQLELSPLNLGGHPFISHTFLALYESQSEWEGCLPGKGVVADTL